MKKGFVLILTLMIFLLFGENVFAGKEISRIRFGEDFEAVGDLSLSADEHSIAQITSVYGIDGIFTKALNLKGSSALFDAVKNFDIAESVIEFDFLPRNITKDGFVVLSVLSDDNLKQVPLLSISGESLYFMGEELAQSLHIDWYKIKLIIGQDLLRMFVNNRQKGEVVPLVEGFDLTKATLRFGVSGANGKNSIYVDNINIFNPMRDEVLIENCDFLRYECAVDEILPGEIEVSISLFNYDKENTAKKLRLLAGLFNGNRMCNAADSQIVSVNGGESITLSQTITVPGNAGNYEIRVFSWDENMKPYNHMSTLAKGRN